MERESKPNRGKELSPRPHTIPIGLETPLGLALLAGNRSGTTAFCLGVGPKSAGQFLSAHAPPSAPFLVVLAPPNEETLRDRANASPSGHSAPGRSCDRVVHTRRSGPTTTSGCRGPRRSGSPCPGSGPRRIRNLDQSADSGRCRSEGPARTDRRTATGPETGWRPRSVAPRVLALGSRSYRLHLDQWVLASRSAWPDVGRGKLARRARRPPVGSRLLAATPRRTTGRPTGRCT